MTERVVIPGREGADSELSVVRSWWRFSARFNVAVSQNIPLARMHEHESEGVMLRWGLARPSIRGNIDFTACGLVRSDSLEAAEIPRTAWLNGQRGIVPLAGFYLWQRTPGRHHQPYYVHLVDQSVLGAAAIWVRAETRDGDVIESCALITVDTNPLLAEIGHTTGQMPAILHRRDYDTWLTSTVSRAKSLLVPYPQDLMRCYPVAPYVNYLEFDRPDLIRPVSYSGGSR